MALFLTETHSLIRLKYNHIATTHMTTYFYPYYRAKACTVDIQIHSYTTDIEALKIFFGLVTLFRSKMHPYTKIKLSSKPQQENIFNITIIVLYYIFLNTHNRQPVYSDLD
jgi:hypothetical protein